VTFDLGGDIGAGYDAVVLLAERDGGGQEVARVSNGAPELHVGQVACGVAPVR